MQFNVKECDKCIEFSNVIYFWKNFEEKLINMNNKFSNFSIQLSPISFYRFYKFCK